MDVDLLAGRLSSKSMSQFCTFRRCKPSSKSGEWHRETRRSRCSASRKGVPHVSHPPIPSSVTFNGRGLTAALVAVVSLGALGAASAPSAVAASSYSPKVYYNGGAHLWSHAYLSSADRNQCGTFNSWSKITSATKRVSSIQNVAHFRSYGIGSITISSSPGGTVTGTDREVQWTNTNGAAGAYMTGGVCMTFWTFYVALQSRGVGFYDGTVRYSATPWL